MTIIFILFKILNFCLTKSELKKNTQIQSKAYQAALDEQYQNTQYKKKQKGQQDALSKAVPPHKPKHERLLIQKMESDKEIVKYLKENSFQDISIYSVAVKRCSELKCPNSINQIVEIVKSKNIHPNIIFYSTILHHLGVWNKFDLQENYFEQWFEQQQVQYDDQSLVPDIITFSTMIKGCANRGDIKQALHYLNLMINTYKIKPNLITFTSLLS
ncbi:pentatricopeptide repeat-containing protein, partial [Reticulomyxa filosa]